ncbi:MAG: hypothetical protein J5I98_20780 [Phaeodactylibacter sp.]|nr:hypothetical protein [Phaeodactylibacter sp.]
MPNSILIIFIGLLILALLTFSFLGFFKNFIPQKIKEKKVSKILVISLMVLIPLMSIVYFFFSTASTFTLVPKNFGAKTPYYKNPDYWNDYENYRNEQVTKIYNPHYWRLAIYGQWEKIEEVGFNVKEIPAGFEITDKYLTSNFYNDSILTIEIKLSKETQNYKYHFNGEQKLRKIDGPDSKTYTYGYGSEGKFSEYSIFNKDGLYQRHTLTPLEGSNYKIAVFDSKGNLIEEEYREHNVFGFPINSTVKKLYEETYYEYPGKLKRTKWVFKETEKFNFDHRGSEVIIHNKLLESGRERKMMIGKGYQRLLVQPNWQLGEDAKVKKWKLHFDPEDEYDNWTVKVYYENNRAQKIDLRQITYKDGTVVGSINPETIKKLN